jgi:predicted Zn-dependent protease with MMP-like domain
MPIRRRGTLARRHPDRRAPLRTRQRPPDAFERLVAEALDALPPDAQRLLANVAIVIEDWPTPEQAWEGTGEEDGWLYGLYEGTPIVEYAADSVPFPNKITLFRAPLEEDFPHPGELADEVRRTVLHELAHHLGFDHDRLTEMGLD